MQIRKTYQEINPELMYAEIRDFVLKQGVSAAESKLETYTLPYESSSFISRGTLTFNTKDRSSNTEIECLRVHIIGSQQGETKLMLDINENLFPQGKSVKAEGKEAGGNDTPDNQRGDGCNLPPAGDRDVAHKK